MYLKYIDLSLFLQYNTFFLLATLPKYFKKSTLIYTNVEFNILSKNLISVLTLLQKHTLFKFTVLTDIFVSDYLLKKENRFVVTYNLLSPKSNLRWNITLDLSLFQFLPTVSFLYKGANWLEREIWDMFGIFFIKHPSLRRILTDYGFKHNPLQKNFPLVGFVELFYDIKLNKLYFRKNNFLQNFRNFLKY